MLKTTIVKMIEVSDWDEFVQEIYGRPYSFQQQDGCKSRGTYSLTVPEEFDDSYMNNEVPEIVNHETMGVKFSKWLERDPKDGLGDRPISNWHINLWWYRNFYPDIQMIANDLHAKGLLESGEYVINIDW